MPPVELTFTLSPEVAEAAATALDLAHGIMAKEYNLDPARADAMGLDITGTTVAEHLRRIATARDILTGRLRAHYETEEVSFPLAPVYGEAGPE